MSAPLPNHLRELGFIRTPFPLTPDADCYFFGTDNQRHQMEIRHCLMSGKGFVLVSGEVGTGKSTFVRYLIDGLQREGAQVALVLNTFLQGPALLQAICRDFGLEAEDDQPHTWLEALNRHLISRHRDGLRSVLIVDDAQNLSLDSLELIRILSNLETRQEKLLQILLTGQQELVEKLRQPSIRQLASRIAQHVQLKHLTLEQAARYVHFRLSQCAAEDAEPITLTASAMRRLYQISRGNPRRIHHVLDRALYGLSPLGKRRINRSLILQASTESGLLSARKSPSVATAALTLLALTGGLVLGGMAWKPEGRQLIQQWAGWLLPSEQGGELLARPASIAPASAPANPEPEAIKVKPRTAADASTPVRGKAPDLDALDELHHCVLRLANQEAEPLPTGITWEAYRDSLRQAGWQVVQQLMPGPEPVGSWFCDYRTEAAGWYIWVPTIPPKPLSDLSRQQVLALQLRLAAAGLYQGPLDGLAGPHTQTALLGFTDRKTAVTTGLNTRELFRLESVLHQAHTPIIAGSRFNG